MSLIDKIMSTPNVNESVEIGDSATAPIGIDEEIEQVDEVEVQAELNEDISDKKRQKRKTSAVWDDVTETVEKGVKVVRCNHCNAKLAISKGAPTTSYKRHIQSCIVRKANLSGKGQGGSQTMLSFDSIGSGSLTSYKFDKEAIYDVTAKMIMVHEYPFKMVEHKLFRIHNKMLNPKYEPIGRLAIRDRAMKLYVEEKEKMKAKFALVGKVGEREK